MNKKVLWTLLAVAALAIVILAIALPGKDGKAPENPQDASDEQAESALPEAETQPEPQPEMKTEDQMGAPTEEGELPRDTSTMKPDGELSPAPPTAGPEDSDSNTDPETAIGLEEDELPIDPS